MSTTTDKLALFKYDPSTDGAQTFNIKKALNDNWDKLDDAVKEILITLANKVTAEPDAVHLLPLLSSAYAASAFQSTYSKSKFGKLSVHIACQPANPISAYETIAVAILPEGYRPAILTELYPGLVIKYRSYNLGVWQVATDGKILFTPTVDISDSDGVTLHGSLSFDAST